MKNEGLIQNTEPTETEEQIHFIQSYLLQVLLWFLQKCSYKLQSPKKKKTKQKPNQPNKRTTKQNNKPTQKL